MHSSLTLFMSRTGRKWENATIDPIDIHRQSEYFFGHVMIVHAVKDQLITPPPCDGTPQNLLNIGQLHCHNTNSQYQNEDVDYKNKNTEHHKTD